VHELRQYPAFAQILGHMCSVGGIFANYIRTEAPTSHTERIPSIEHHKDGLTSYFFSPLLSICESTELEDMYYLTSKNFNVRTKQTTVHPRYSTSGNHLHRK
jgi:hypothetical protein